MFTSIDSVFNLSANISSSFSSSSILSLSSDIIYRYQFFLYDSIFSCSMRTFALIIECDIMCQVVYASFEFAITITFVYPLSILSSVHVHQTSRPLRYSYHSLWLQIVSLFVSLVKALIVSSGTWCQAIYEVLIQVYNLCSLHPQQIQYRQFFRFLVCQLFVWNCNCGGYAFFETLIFLKVRTIFSYIFQILCMNSAFRYLSKLFQSFSSNL